ncbi:MAG TPA: helix-turn-helix domain-containing protein [Acidimicrobiia bacterium]|nr:helix-turn-helix domain-containing protein [Acidimicrobiia bacterium]
MTDTRASGERRRYDSAVRRAQAAQTRERILSAAATLLRKSSIRNWDGLTIRAVAERAGVHERTVYRHFANENALRDSVMQRLEAEAGVDLAHMRLDDVADVAASTIRHVSAYRMEPEPLTDPTLVAAKQRLHDALVAAVAEHTEAWTEADRTIAAAVLDVLWAPGAYERLVANWQLNREEAIRAVTWAIELVRDAINAGRGPSG